MDKTGKTLCKLKAKFLPHPLHRTCICIWPLPKTRGAVPGGPRQAYALPASQDAFCASRWRRSWRCCGLSRSSREIRSHWPVWVWRWSWLVRLWCLKENVSLKWMKKIQDLHKYQTRIFIEKWERFFNNYIEMGYNMLSFLNVTVMSVWCGYKVIQSMTLWMKF